MLKKALPLLVFGALVLVWEWAARTRGHLLFVLPPPSAIAASLWECHTRLFHHTLCTLKEMAGGFFLALSVAFPLAWTMMRFKTSRAIFQPLFVVIQCLPMFTLAPLMVLWFGWGYTAIVIPTALMIFFPLTLNIYQGLRSTPRDLLEFFQTNQATGLQTFFKLRLPYAVPHIFAGFRISAAIAGIGAVAGEWAGAQEGLGILMLESRRNADLEITFSALVCLTTMTAALYGLVLLAEKLALPPRRVTFKKPRFAFAAFLAGTLFFSSVSCQREATTNTRLLLDWIPNPNHVPLYVAVDRGYFAEEGIKLEIQKMHDNGGGIAYLTAGKADLLVYHLPGTLRAASHGASLSIVGLLIKQPLSGLIYAQDDTVTTPADLSKKTLGYCMGNPDTSFLDLLLSHNHITPKERRNVSIDIISAMGTGSIDCVYGGYWNIEPSQFRALGVETAYFTLGDLGVPNYYELMIVASRPSPQSDPHFVARFHRALQKSLAFCQAFPEEAFAHYLRHNPDKRSKTITWERDAWEATHPILATDQTVDPTCIDTFHQWLLQEHLIPHPVDTTALLLP